MEKCPVFSGPLQPVGHGFINDSPESLASPGPGSYHPAFHLPYKISVRQWNEANLIFWRVPTTGACFFR